jgi:hypothetical protein
MIICDTAYFTLYMLVTSSAVVPSYILYDTAAVRCCLAHALFLATYMCVVLHSNVCVQTLSDMLTHCSLLLPAQPVLHHDYHVDRWVWRCVPGYTERNAVDAGGHYEWCHADWRHSSRFHGGLYGDGRTR